MKNTTDKDIRLNWLESLKDATENDEVYKISSAIGWGFTYQDIIIITEIHEMVPELRETIYALLEDCNFHHENGLLEKGKYDECRAFAAKEFID